MKRGFEQWIDGQGGIVHSTSAKAAGFSRHAMAMAVDAGVRHVRRSWLATARCAPERVAAAEVGGRVTCITAARRLGLWVPPHAGTHVAVPHGASRFTAGDLVLHWATGPVPLPRTCPDEDILNVLFHVARCFPHAEALCVWESALRLGAADAAVLARVEWRCSAAVELAGLASRLSDAGTETLFVDLMRGIGVRVRQQIMLDGHPVDGLIGDRLVVQIDGFAHHRAADRRRDIRADARLLVRGFTVLRFDYQQILFDQAYVVDAVRIALAQGLHRASPVRP